MASRFEYAQISLSRQPEATVHLPDGSEQNHPGVVTALNELGKDGWELVSVDSPSNFGTLLYLKREIVA